MNVYENKKKSVALMASARNEYLLTQRVSDIRVQFKWEKIFFHTTAARATNEMSLKWNEINKNNEKLACVIVNETRLEIVISLQLNNDDDDNDAAYLTLEQTTTPIV